nr:hypothetical protein [Tanacetum cinerariifolium]
MVVMCDSILSQMRTSSSLIFAISWMLIGSLT